MKIAVAIVDAPNYHGGPLMNMKRVLPMLKQRGHEILALILYHGYSDTLREFRRVGIRCKSTFMPKYSETSVKWFLKQINEFKPDVFIPDSIIDACYAAGWVKGLGIPTIIAQRGVDEENKTIVGFFGVGNSSFSASAIVFVNKFNRDLAHAVARAPIKTEVIPSGVFIPEKVARQDNKNLKVVYLGRLDQHVKNVKNIMWSFVHLLRDHPEMEFGFIGDGEDKVEMMQHVAESNCEGKIKFSGALFGEELQKELLKYNVVVLCSDHEGMPGSLLAGMACGLVPVCTQTDGIEELVQHHKTGLMAKDKEHDFQQCIVSLKSNSLRQALAKEARDLITNNFSLDHCVQKWENLCRELVDESRPVTAGIDFHEKQLLPKVPSEFRMLEQRRTDDKRLLHKDERLRAWRSLKSDIKYHSGLSGYFKLLGK